MSNTISARLAAAAVLLALVAGACGGGDAARDAGTAADKAAGKAADKAQEAAGSAAESTDKVEIVDFAYKPEMVKVKSGTKVSWSNLDAFDHTVTAVDKSFDSKVFKKGDKPFTHRFDTPGTFEYFCDVHNYMTGSVVVE